ncbi:MAG: caspase family protein, partial [Bacteroidota bacterium]
AFEKLYNKYVKLKGKDRILSEDVVIIFFSGHGISMHNNAFRLVPSNYDQDARESSTVDYEENVLKYLNKMACHKYLFIDACHSGASGAKSMDFQDEALSKVLYRLHSAQKGLITLTSCGHNELSYESDTLENSYFTATLIEAFSGEAVKLQDGTSLQCSTDADGYLSIRAIHQFIQKRMEDITSNRQPQHPQLIKGNEQLDTDLPLFRTQKN